MFKKKPELVVAKGKNMDTLAGRGGDNGWNEGWGQEIIHREMLPRVKPGGRVYDLGGDEGRASNPFTSRGHRVTIIDSNPNRVADGKKMRRQAGLPNRVRCLNLPVHGLTRKILGGGADAVIASDVLNHMSKQEADRTIANLPRLLNRRRGGVIYVNAPSTENLMFEEPEYFGAVRLDAGTLEVECSCSGEPRPEKIPFYQPGEIAARLALQGGKILASHRLERNDNGILDEVVALFKPRKRK